MPFLKDGKEANFRTPIPNEYRSVEPRSEIYVSLKTTNQLEAYRLAVAIQEQTLADLSTKLLGKPAAITESYYREMTERSRAHGFSYRPVDELLAGPPAVLVSRMSALMATDPSGKDKTTADAVLGMVEKPRLKVSGLPAFYEQENRTKLAIKTERELHKCRLPLERAAKALTDLVEDRYVDEVTYVEAQVMFDWLKDRVADAGAPLMLDRMKWTKELNLPASICLKRPDLQMPRRYHLRSSGPSGYGNG